LAKKFSETNYKNHLVQLRDVLSEDNDLVLLNDFRNCDLDVIIQRHLDGVQHLDDAFLTNVVDLCPKNHSLKRQNVTIAQVHRGR